MNDRFKFRIFEKETKTMVELDAVGYSSFDPFKEGKSRLIMIPSGLVNTFHYDKQCLYDNEKFSKPMQCTGIADKNGKLIYEGDVLKNLLNGKKYKVAWVGCQASFELHQILSPNDEDYKKAQPIAIYFANGGFQRFQVLGNIYENPELLEEKCANQLNRG